MPKFIRYESMALVPQAAAAREGGGVSFQYPQLTATNYTTWAIKVEAMLDAQGLWEAVAPAEGAAVEARKDKMARAQLLQTLPEDILLQVATKRTAKELWDSLKTRFVGADRVKSARMATLKGEFDKLQMKDGDALDDYAGKLSGMSVQYANLGATLEDSVLVKKLLNSVPDRFYPVVAGIEQFCNTETMVFEEAVGRLKAFEERLHLRNPGRNGDSQLLLTQAEWQARQKNGNGDSSSNNKGKNGAGENRGRGWRGRDKGRGRGGRGNLSGKDGPSSSSNCYRDKRHIKCFNCDMMGHYASECRKKKRAEEANLTRAEEEPELLLSASVETHTELLLQARDEREDPNNIWYFDNGASNHMTGERRKFKDLDQSVQGHVRFGDGSKVKIQGKGSVMLQFKGGQQRLLTEVYYIPELHNNIISCGQLAERGSKIVMRRDHLFVYDSNDRLLIRIKSSPNRLYKATIEAVEPVCLLADTTDPAWLWHLRLGHVNFQSLKLLTEKEMAIGVPHISHPDKLCQECMVAKQAREPFPRSSNRRAEELLELFYADLCGPITPPTPAGNNYFMLVVDDYSRWMWVDVIKTKDQACEAFKKIIQRAENTSGRRVKVLRTDRGGEFLSSVFRDLCDQAGIERQLTAPYSPQQNGVVERKNRTVMAMARSLLKSMNVPGKFWGEAVRHAVYLLNRLPTKALGERTPFEAWTGRKPHLAHLRVFGCLAHVKVTTPYLKKLDDRSQGMVYLGVEEGSKAHRLYDPRKEKLHVSRDVKFNEQTGWCWDVGANAKEEPSFTVEGVFFPEPELEEAVSEIESQFPVTTSTQEPVPHTPTRAEVKIPSGPMTRARARVAREAAATKQRLETSEPITPTTTKSASLSDNSDEGPVRFKSVTDLLRETSRLEPQEEDVDGELFLLELDEPTRYEEAAGQSEWEEAMRKEIETIKKNGTWTLTELPEGQKSIGLKWVYKLKRDSDGGIIKHKARLVAKGFVQRPGVDFDEVFAPVARLDTVRLILAIAANRRWEVHHLDVKSAFLQGELQEEVYVKQPEGFVVKGKEQCVYKLHKALYGLRQAPRAWNTRLDKSLKQLGFTKCAQDQAVYTRGEGQTGLIVGVYVDDLIVTGENREEIVRLKKQMMKEFEMSDLGLLSFYLGIEVEQEENRITLKQSAYAKKVLKQFGMAECNPTKFPMEQKAQLHKDLEGEPVDATDYRRIIGCLRYLLHTRPDLSYAVGVASRFMERPTVMHHKAVKQILRYLKGTIYCGLVYVKGVGEEVITGYSDSNMAGDLDDRKSTSGMAFYVNENLVTWNSQKQKSVALSSCEAEFMAATAAACQALWLRSLLGELTKEKPKPVKLFVDNRSAIALMKNPVFHGRSKHIDIRYHFIRDCVESREIIVEFVSTEEQKADALTKALLGVKLATMRHILGLRELGPRQD